MEEPKDLHSVPIGKGIFVWPIQEGEKPSLLGSRCKSCGTFFYPPISVCHHCYQEETLETVPLSRRGKLYTYTTVQMAPPGFRAPYHIGYVDLAEGVRVFGHMEGELSVGMEMELSLGIIKKNQEGVPVIGPIFRPVQG